MQIAQCRSCYQDVQYYRFIECVFVACGRLQWESFCSVTWGLLFPGKGKKMRMVVTHCKGTEQAQNRGYFQRSGPWGWQFAEKPGAASCSLSSAFLSRHSFSKYSSAYLPEAWHWTRQVTVFCEVNQKYMFLLAALFRQEKNPVSFFNVINNEVGFFPSAAVWWY